MRRPLALAALCLNLGLTALAMGACDKSPPLPRVPAGEPAVPGAGTAPAGDTSVPPASTVLTPANEAAKTGTAAGRSNSSMSGAQESAAMPMPGQNNDHSAPLGPARPASAP